MRASGPVRHASRSGCGAVGRFGLVLAAVLAVAACDPAVPVAATLEDGEPTLLPGLCPDEAVSAVFVTAGVDDEDEVLWRIEAAEPVRLEAFVIGETPDGFKQTVPPQDAMFAGEHTSFVVTETSIELYGSFDVATLHEGEVRVDTEVASRERFDDDRHCG